MSLLVSLRLFGRLYMKFIRQLQQSEHVSLDDHCPLVCLLSGLQLPLMKHTSGTLFHLLSRLALTISGPPNPFHSPRSIQLIFAGLAQVFVSLVLLDFILHSLYLSSDVVFFFASIKCPILVEGFLSPWYFQVIRLWFTEVKGDNILLLLSGINNVNHLNMFCNQ